MKWWLLVIIKLVGLGVPRLHVGVDDRRIEQTGWEMWMRQWKLICEEASLTASGARFMERLERRERNKRKVRPINAGGERFGH